MRISSGLFPFASHDKHGYDLDYAAAELKVRIPSYSAASRADSDFTQAAGDLANLYGHRMTLHPGQVCRLVDSSKCRLTPPSLPVYSNWLSQAECR